MESVSTRWPDVGPRRGLLRAGLAAAALPWLPGPASAQRREAMQSWPLMTPQPAGIHDVAPAPDGGVWFSAQRSGHLGWFDPASGRTDLVPLGPGSSPHGVIAGPDGAAWLTDGGQQAIARVSWPDREVRLFRLPADTPYANLNTCAFDGDGQLWFTGQAGVIGRVALPSGRVTVWDAPKGRGPYGICATPAGDIWWCSLAGSFIARIDRRTGASTVVQPPTPQQGARRVWSDSAGRIWVSEWLSGQLSLHDPRSGRWRHWLPPGEAAPRTYAVWVDSRDQVWCSEWAGNAVLRFDPGSETFTRFAFPRPGAGVRQILGRTVGDTVEVWLPESGNEVLGVVRSRFG